MDADLSARLSPHPLSLLTLDGLLESPTVGSGLHDVCVECEPVDDGFAQPLLGKDLGPLAEREVGRDDQGGQLRALVEHLEDQFSLRRCERHICQFIEDEKLDLRITRNDLGQRASMSSLTSAAVVVKRTLRDCMHAVTPRAMAR
jgi:hypothetical protein